MKLLHNLEDHITPRHFELMDGVIDREPTCNCSFPGEMLLPSYIGKISSLSKFSLREFSKVKASTILACLLAQVRLGTTPQRSSAWPNNPV